jgi:hypothetical protein
MNSKSAAASHQLSSFFGVSADFGIAVFPRAFCDVGFEAVAFAAGAGAEAELDVVAVRSGCI